MITKSPNMITVKSPDELLTLLAANQCSDRVILDLQYRNITAGDATKIVAALKMGSSKCLGGLIITFEGAYIEFQGLKNIIAALSDKCPKDLTIDLKRARIVDLDVSLWHSKYNKAFEAIELFVAALKSGNCPEELGLDLSFLVGLQEGDKLAHLITGALKSGNCPKKLRLDLTLNWIKDEGAQHLASALEHEKCPPHLHLKLVGNSITDKGIEYFANALESGNCPSHISLDLEDNYYGKKGVLAIIHALQNPKCPQKMPSIGIGVTADKSLDDEVITALQEAIEAYRCKQATYGAAAVQQASGTNSVSNFFSRSTTEVEMTTFPNTENPSSGM